LVLSLLGVDDDTRPRLFASNLAMGRLRERAEAEPGREMRRKAVRGGDR